jgi:hypothetical protein
MTSSAILGDWTHRRGDRGGARAVAAELSDRARPTIAWSWEPDHGGRVDQVRVVGSAVVVATMMPRDAGAPQWEHAVVYVLDAATGREVARRALPDPVPVAAMAVDQGIVHVVATRRGEPIFWYALTVGELVPQHRLIVSTEDESCPEDVLDAWATPSAGGSGLWLELDVSAGDGSSRVHAYAFVEPGGAPAAILMKDRHAATDAAPLARDACAGDGQLFVPIEGLWSGEADAFPPTISRLDPPPAPAAATEAWASTGVFGLNAQIHALGAEGMICGVAMAEEPGRPDRGRVEALVLDRATGAVRWRAQHDRVPVRSRLGNAARVARRPNGELLFQGMSADGEPCTPLLCARPDGQLDELLLGSRGRHVLDAALGDLVLSHREDRDGSVEVCGFGIDNEGRLLGRRAVSRWAIDAGNLGGETTVYAGAGAIVVRGARGVRAVKL